MKTLTHLYEDRRERASVRILLFKRTGQILVGHVKNRPSPGSHQHEQPDDWQVPGGGVHRKEEKNIFAAVFRELKEEFYLGSGQIHFIAASQHPIYSPYVGHAAQDKYDGTRIASAAFLMGDLAEPSLASYYNRAPPAFDAYQAIRLGLLPELMSPDQRELGQELVRIYKPVEAVLREFWNSVEEISEPDLAKKVQERILQRPSVPLGLDIPSFPGLRI